MMVANNILITLGGVSAGLVTLTALILLSNLHWRWILAGLATQYLGVFLLTAQTWSIEMAAVKLVAGWISCLVIWLAAREALTANLQEWKETETASPSGLVFRWIAAGLALLVVVTTAPLLASWIPGINPVQSWGGLLLICTGLLGLGLTARPFRVAIGLLTILSGFEIIHAAIESSALLAGLLAIATMGLALTCSYLLNSSTFEVED